VGRGHSRRTNRKVSKDLITAYGKGSPKRLKAELLRGEALKAKLARGEDISPEDEAWLLETDKTGETLNKLKTLTADGLALISLDNNGKATYFKNLKTGEEDDDPAGAGGHVEVPFTPRMLKHIDIVDENQKTIVAETIHESAIAALESGGTEINITTLNGHSTAEALLAVEIRGVFRKTGELPPNLADQMQKRGWNITVPITASDLQAFERQKLRQRHDAKLFDLLLQAKESNRFTLLQHSAHIKQILRSAHKFVLTDDAAIRIAEAIRAYPEMLADNSQFAIPPFETTWIEMPLRNFQRKLIGENQEIDDRSDRTIGYLIHKDRVYVAGENEDLDAMMMPFSYGLNTPSTFEEEQRACKYFGVSRAQLDSFLWGHTVFKELRSGYMRSLRRQHSLRLEYTDETLARATEAQLKVGNSLYVGAAGDLRNILGILLAMNQPTKYLRTSDVPHRRKMTAKGPRVYMAHSVIEFDLNKKPIRQLLRRNMEKGTHASPRWHQVKGHFCHDSKGRGETGCIHDGGLAWVELEPRKWECQECGGKRWWREYPEGRGDAAIGFVQSQHLVKAA
jgi:hypothetical protein